MNIYSIKDNLAGNYGVPEVSDAEAIYLRGIKIMLSSEQKNLVCLRPEDFSVYKLGQYDIKTGKIVPCEPEFIVNVIDLVEVNHNG